MNLNNPLLLIAIHQPGLFVMIAAMLGCMVRWQIVPSDRKRTEMALVFVLLTTILGWAGEAIARSLSSVRPGKLDLFVYQFDHVFHDPSFVLGRMLYGHRWIQPILQIAYNSIPTAVAAAIAYHYYGRHRGEDIRLIVTAFALNIGLSPIVYSIVPVCGPIYAFQSFPFDPGPVHASLMHINAAPNGFPSIHFSTALLIVWALRRSPTGVVLATINALLMVGATLGSGEHYLLDLLASFPYAALMCSLSRYLIERWDARKMPFEEGPQAECMES